MAWSMDETFNAIMQYGLKGAPTIFPTVGYTFTGAVALTSHTLVGFDGGQALINFTSVSDLNTWGGSRLIFEPSVVKRGIVGWYFEKNALSLDCYIRCKDGNGNTVYEFRLPFQYDDSNPRDFYKWLDVWGYDFDTLEATFGDNAPIYLITTANPSNPNDPLQFTWACGYSPFTSLLGLWTADPQLVDNVGSMGWNTVDFLTYIDELFEGDYSGNSGEIAPTGGTGGGSGGFYRPSYGIGIPPLPSISVCDTGMVSVYSVNTAQLQALGRYLWDDNFFNQLVKLFQSPLDNIITLQSIPMVSSALRGHASNIIVGNVDTGIQATSKLTTTYYEINCGTMNVKEYYNSFADYNGYLIMDLYLPYCGIVRINPDDCMGGKINVVYHVDVFSGSCVAFVRCYTNGVWTVLSEHSGNITAQFPITGSNFASVYIGAINSIGMGASGNMLGMVNSAMNMKPQYGRSGGVTSVSGLMGIQKPYLIYSTPKYIIADNFRSIKGYTSNLKVRVGNCSGFLQATVDNTDLENITCTRGELDLIRNALAQGIYI